MKKYFIFIVFILALTSSLFAQNDKKDSLSIGRVCKLVLYNSYQAEGRILARENDTLTFQTDITNLHIFVKDIKFVLNPEVELSDLEEIDTLEYNKISSPVVIIDTTEACDIFMDNKSEFLGVRLMVDSDSTIRMIKDGKMKILNIAGIRKIVFKPAFPFGGGYFIGSLVGLGIGLVTGITLSGGHGYLDIPGVLLFSFLTSIPAGLIGGIVGMITSKDDVYLFNNGIYPVKIKRITFAMEKHY